MGKGKGSIRKRRNWRDKAFEILGNRHMKLIPKGERSDSLRNVLIADKKKNSRGVTRKK